MHVAQELDVAHRCLCAILCQHAQEAPFERILGREHTNTLEELRPLRTHCVDEAVCPDGDVVIERGHAQPRAVVAFESMHLQQLLEKGRRNATADPQVERRRVVHEEGAVRLELLEGE